MDYSHTSRLVKLFTALETLFVKDHKSFDLSKWSCLINCECVKKTKVLCPILEVNTLNAYRKLISDRNIIGHCSWFENMRALYDLRGDIVHEGILSIAEKKVDNLEWLAFRMIRSIVKVTCENKFSNFNDVKSFFEAEHLKKQT